MGRPRKNSSLLNKHSDRHQRLFERRSLDAEVVLEDEQGLALLVMDAVNLSVGGVYVRETLPLLIGSRAFISLTLPISERPIRLVAQVARVDRKEKGGAPIGLGLRFVEVGIWEKNEIERWIASQ